MVAVWEIFCSDGHPLTILAEFCGAASRVAVYNSGTAVSIPPSQPTNPGGGATTTGGPAAPTTGAGTVAQYGQCGGQGYT